MSSAEIFTQHAVLITIPQYLKFGNNLEGMACHLHVLNALNITKQTAFESFYAIAMKHSALHEIPITSVYLIVIRCMYTASQKKIAQHD